MIEVLQATRQKSYYYKAIINYDYTSGIATLYSYTIPVATYDLITRKLTVANLHSKTTSNHMRDFIYKFTGEWIAKGSEIMERYGA